MVERIINLDSYSLKIDEDGRIISAGRMRDDIYRVVGHICNIVGCGYKIEGEIDQVELTRLYGEHVQVSHSRSSISKLYYLSVKIN